jgi:hypothetical protein
MLQHNAVQLACSPYCTGKMPRYGGKLPLAAKSCRCKVNYSHKLPNRVYVNCKKKKSISKNI